MHDRLTAERIRDKIAASKKKGLWMGGVPPLGYGPHPDPNRRELVVVEIEAAVVRQFFTLYAEHKCLNIVEREAGRRHVWSLTCISEELSAAALLLIPLGHTTKSDVFTPQEVAQTEVSAPSSC